MEETANRAVPTAEVYASCSLKGILTVPTKPKGAENALDILAEGRDDMRAFGKRQTKGHFPRPELHSINIDKKEESTI